MDTTLPSSNVNSVQHLARGVLSQVDAERTDIKANEGIRDERMMAPTSHIDDPVRYEKLAKDANGAFVTNGRVAGHRVDSPEAMQIVKNINTATDLKISRWSEVAGYLRWGTIGLMTLTFSAFAAGATTGATSLLAGINSMSLASVGAALVSGPFLGLAAASLVCAGVGLFMTQHVRKLQADRFMDVQGFMQERGATKIGQEVAQSLGAAPEVARGDGRRWADAISAEQAQQADISR